MAQDPWSDLRAQADAVREGIESRLGTSASVSLQEAPEDKGAFSLATFVYAKELGKKPSEIASLAAGTAVPSPFQPLQAIDGYVNFIVDPAAFDFPTKRFL